MRGACVYVGARDITYKCAQAESKGGLVTYLFLNGKDKEGIAKELKDAFKLTDEQALKVTRRITGRARFFQRALKLTAAK